MRNARSRRSPSPHPGVPSLERLEPRLLLSASLLKDIHPGSETTTSAPSGLVVAGDAAYFVVNGLLWRTDGTESGTGLAYPWWNGANQLTAAGDTLYFAGYHPFIGAELFFGDAGDSADINPGTASSAPRDLTDFEGSLVFVADDGTHGEELWISDGTVQGTRMVRDILPGAVGSDIHSLCVLGDTVYFVADDGTHGHELWKSDGTAAGTSLVRDLFTGPHTSSIGNLVNVNGTLCFSGNAGHDAGGLELWKSDGTAGGTVRVKDINPGRAGSSPALLTNVNGVLFFSAFDETAGDELWKSDGTAEGTVRVRDIGPGPQSVGLDKMIGVGDRLFFAMNREDTGTELWTSDGTEAGTVLLYNINFLWNSSNPQQLMEAGGYLFFTAFDSGSGRELWRSDGTTAGTVRVSDIVPGGGGSYPYGIVEFQNSLMFAAYHDTGWALYRSNGLTGPISRITYIDRTTYGRGSNPTEPTTFGNAVYFAANDPVNGTELWRTDGTESGTTLVKDIASGSGSSNPSQFTVAGNLLYFRSGNQIWRTDGTPSGTQFLSGGSFNQHSFTPAGGMLYYVASDGSGEELWRSDGTPAGTQRVADINPGSGSSRINALTPLSDTKLYFVANDGSHGDELYVHDIASNATSLVTDLMPGSASSGPWLLTAVGTDLFFRASNGSNGWELWVTDGSAGGTRLVKDIRPGNDESWVSSLVNVGGTLYFTASDGVTGIELWRSNGTAAGTSLVADIHPGPHGSSPDNLFAYNGILYFTANDGVHGHELWRSDGTPQGTYLLNELRPGPGGSTPRALQAVDGRMFFVAFDGGSERWWFTNGSAASTAIAPGPGSAAFLNHALIYASWSAEAGQELWKAELPPEEAAAPLNEFATTVSFASAIGPSGPATGSSESISEDSAESRGQVLGASADSTPTILDGLIWPGRPRMEAFGMQTVAVTGQDMWSNEWHTDVDVPNEQAVRALADNIVAQGITTAIPDIEYWPLDVRIYPDGLVQMYMERMIQVADWMHEQQPGLSVGFYSMAPMFEYATAAHGSPAARQAWRDANQRLAPLAERVDVIYPSIYVWFESRADWAASALSNLEEARQYGKPVAPFIWPQHMNTIPEIASEYVPADYWRLVLNTLGSGGNDLVLWGGMGRWDDDNAWWSVMRDWLAQRDPHTPETPAIIANRFASSAATAHTLSVTFNQDVGPSITPDDLSIFGPQGGEFLPADVSYDSETHTATFSFVQALPPGRYEAVVNAAGVASGGNQMAEDHVFTLAVAVESVAVNDGHAQRSMVRSLTVTFTSAVSLGAGAFTLTGRNGAGDGTLLSWSNPSGDGRRWVMSFSGTPVLGGSLADGVYDLTAFASQISFVNGSAMSGDLTFSFHRLFSDHDGDGDSDNADLFQLRSAYGKFEDEEGYRWWWDYTSDGDVDNADVFQVRSRRTVQFKGY